MTISIHLKRNIPLDRLNTMYDKEDYYWYLHSPDFVNRFIAPIGRLVEQFGGYCLDVGCGEGWLLDHVGLTSYHGIDGSENAIKKARDLHSKFKHRECFQVARFENYDSNCTFGTIVFGGILDVLVEPESYIDLLRQYEDRFCPSFFIIYDLQRLDTSEIDHHYNLIKSFEDTAELDGIPSIKLCRKIRVYAC